MLGNVLGVVFVFKLSMSWVYVWLGLMKCVGAGAHADCTVLSFEGVYECWGSVLSAVFVYVTCQWAGAKFGAGTGAHEECEGSSCECLRMCVLGQECECWGNVLGVVFVHSTCQ